MEQFFKRLTSLLARTLTLKSRIIVMVAGLVLIPTFLLPLWNMTFLAQQYPEGLELYIYSHSLDSGDDGNDLNEINILNHYIGMAELEQEDFSELKWIPLIIGLIIVITFRAAIVGTLGSVLDIIVISIYFAMFSVWSFYNKLFLYGHNLDPKASVTVDPFTPPVFGYKMVGQFEVWSYPAAGTWFFVIFGLLLVVGLILSRKSRLD